MNREYACNDCYFLYEGYWTPEKGREVCPACSSPVVHALDSFGAFYWEDNLRKTLGPDEMKKLFWWTPSRVSKEWAEILEGNGTRKVEKI